MTTRFNLFYFLLLILLFSKGSSILGQGMEDAKWWMGIKGGINFSQIAVQDHYNLFENLAQTDQANKEYKTFFKNPGPSVAFTIGYNFTPFLSLNVQPGYVSQRFTYISKFSWKDSLDLNFNLSHTHKNKLHYIEFPLLLKYEYSIGKFQPYIQGGGFYSYLLNGKKTITIEEKEQSLEGDFELNNTIQEYNINQLYIHSQIGLIGGGGVSIDLNYFRISLECNFRYGLNNITNRKNRLELQQLTNGAYDIPDDIQLQSLEFSLHCATPLDFLIHTPGMSGRSNKRRK